jgi:hypothetical protein
MGWPSFARCGQPGRATPEGAAQKRGPGESDLPYEISNLRILITTI